MVEDKNIERSASGAPILRHTQPVAGAELVSGDQKSIDATSDHIEKHIGKIANVFHEIASDYVHVDVRVVAPTAQRNYYTLITSGMSDRPMTVPSGAEAWKHAELLIHLPRSWKLGQDAFKDENNYWPTRLLKFLARLPHEYKTWLYFGHTVPNGDPAKPYSTNVQFSGAVLVDPLLMPRGFNSLTMPDGRQVAFYNVLPLYTEEMDYKLAHGLGLRGEKGGLGDRFQNPQTGVPVGELLVVRPGRRNAVTGKYPTVFG